MIPEKIQDREDYIYQQVQNGFFDAKWIDITRNIKGKKLTLRVMEDGLMVDGIRVNTSANLAQKLADLLDASLPTPMVVDMMYSASTRKAVPCPIQISSSTASMIKHSSAVDKQLFSNQGLVATCGKHWVLDKQLEAKKHAACNYGWHFGGSFFRGIKGFPPATVEAGANTRVIQPNATAHDAHHVDYSQICQLVSQACWVDDVEMRFSDLIKDANLAHLVSHQGPLTIDRQPGTVKENQNIVLLPLYITL